MERLLCPRYTLSPEPPWLGTEGVGGKPGTAERGGYKSAGGSLDPKRVTGIGGLIAGDTHDQGWDLLGHAQEAGSLHCWEHCPVVKWLPRGCELQRARHPLESGDEGDGESKTHKDHHHTLDVQLGFDGKYQTLRRQSRDDWTCIWF